MVLKMVSNEALVKYPKISVIVITKNNSNTIEKCLTGLLNQDYPKDSYEIIFVDGLSCDGTREIIEKYKRSQSLPLIKIFTENIGTMGYARNIGVNESKGNILVFLDGDAYPTVNWLSQIAQSFMADPDLSILGGLDVLTPENKTRDTISSWRRLRKSVGLKAISRIRTVNLAIKRDILTLCGGFDSKLSHFDEAELIARLYFNFKIENVLFDPQIIVFHERRNSGLVKRIKKVFKKSVIGVPILFRKHMMKMMLSDLFSAVSTSMFFVFANFIFFLLLPFIILGLIPVVYILSFLISGSILVLLYTINMKRHIGKFEPKVVFILMLDCLIRFIGTLFGLIRLLSFSIYQLVKKLSDLL